MHLTDPVPHILSKKPNLPAGIDAIIQRAMAKNMGERYQTAHDMVEALNNALEQKDRDGRIKNMNKPLHVFVCHASQDKYAVRELYDRLKLESWIDPWLDKVKILPGQLWEWAIEKAVEESDVVIVCLSNQSITKEGYVQKEIRYAYEVALEKPEGTIYLIPLRLDNCEIPRRLRSLQYVDYFGDEKKNAEKLLLDALKVRFAQKKH